MWQTHTGHKAQGQRNHVLVLPILQHHQRGVQMCTLQRTQTDERAPTQASSPAMVSHCSIFEWRRKEHLVLVDSYSGWFEIDYLLNLTSVTVITKLICHFAVHRIARQLMTDNARTFNSSEFKAFARTWDFEHVTSSPLYPRSNGRAE